jgi:tellurite resistance protein TerC
MELFHYLHYGLSLILAFVGAKMLLSHVYHVPTAATLGVITLTITVCIVASIHHPRQSDP